MTPASRERRSVVLSSGAVSVKLGFCGSSDDFTHTRSLKILNFDFLKMLSTNREHSVCVFVCTLHDLVLTFFLSFSILEPLKLGKVYVIERPCVHSPL